MKMKFKIALLTLIAGGFCVGAVAQTEDTTPVDGYYKKTELEKAKPFDYPKVKNGQVRFYKRIWRDIDLKDPENAIFVTPGSSLIEVIVAAIQEGNLTAYDPVSTKENPTGDAFTTPLTPEQAMGHLTDSVLVPQFDEEGNQIGAQMTLNDFNPQSITKFRVKEDIFFDRQRSRIETRIVGIAPLIQINAASEMIGEQPAFWLYFPQARKTFVTKEVADPKRHISNLTFDDIFLQHSFKSIIVKESNPGELSIRDYAKDNEELKEAERIEDEINEYKKKTWKH
jgi:gliding motility associated protien GldN